MFTTDDPLQWGRVPTNAEGDMAIKKLKPTMTLQWGRVLTNAEGRGQRRIHHVARSASMGPRSHERGRCRPRIMIWTLELQRGRVLANAEGAPI